MQYVVGRLSLHDQHLDVLHETKTKNNIPVQIGITVQYKVVAESAYDAWYRLISPTRQINAYVCDVIDSTLCDLDLNQTLQSKENIASAVLEQLNNAMKENGYSIINVVVTNINTDYTINISTVNERKSSQDEADKAVRQETRSFCGYCSVAPWKQTIEER